MDPKDSDTLGSRRIVLHRMWLGLVSGRPGQPAEIAPLYVLLASDDASFTSGDVFASTGGKPAN